MRKVTVTGGGGFIGSHIVDALLAAGNLVTVLDDFSTGYPENLSSAGHAEIINASILNEGALTQAVLGADVVFHLAAIPSVPRSVREPLLSHAVNSTGTLMVLDTCRKLGVKRVVYASSSSVQGDLGDQVRSERIHGIPKSPYGVAKYTGEMYAAVYADIHGLDIVTLRYFNVYGPRQRPRGAYSTAIPAFMSAALEGEPATIFGDGQQTRDFTYVGDVVRASLLAMDSETAPGLTINICSGTSVTILDLALTIARIFGVEMDLTFSQDRGQEVRHIRSDPELAKAALGFAATTPLEEGLRRTAAWYADHVHHEHAPQ